MPATILVVEDNECMRELLRLHLANAGYAVLVAEDAIVAGHLLLRKRPDMILTDIEMPHMDGLEFVRAIRADAATRSVPVVFLSGRDDSEEQAKKLGAEFLAKPLLVSELLSTVARVARQGKQMAHAGKRAAHAGPTMAQHFSIKENT
jgi:two-component system chemotaxis response regulator CheY